MNINGPREDFLSPTDVNTETCLNVQNTLFKMGEIRLDLIIPQKIDGGIVKVYFNQEIMCGARKEITNLQQFNGFKDS